MEMYQELHKWDEAIIVAEAKVSVCQLSFACWKYDAVSLCVSDCHCQSDSESTFVKNCSDVFAVELETL